MLDAGYGLMKLFVAIAEHATLLPHFLRHYREAGVSRFFIAVEGHLEKQVTAIAAGFPVEVICGLDTAESIEGGTAAVSRMRMSYAGPDEWVALADLDEFQVHAEGIAATTADADREDANVVRGIMVDRVATDGRLKPVGSDDDLCVLFPERCFITARLQGGFAHKCVLVKGHLESGRTEAGESLAHHHMMGERVASNIVEIRHFKWNSEAVERMQVAIARTKAAGLSFWVEYERVLEHLRCHGRLRWEDFTELDIPQP